MKKFFIYCCLFILISGFISCKKTKALDTGKIDLDLSEMNYNMLTSIGFEMMTEPEKYAGKTVKVSGNFYTSEYEGKRYFSAITWDATGCCPAGFDFIPPAKMKYPEDFPADNEKITVTGIFKFLEIDGAESLVFMADNVQF